MTTHQRTPYEATLDCRFGSRFCDLNARLYRRLDALFGFFSLFGGTSVFAGTLASYPKLAVPAALIVAASGVLERLIGPAVKAHEFEAQRRRYADLDARNQGMTLANFDAELRQIQAASPSGFRALELPAHNANLRTHGHDDLTEPLPLLDRIASALA
ncbi:hypothetical protein ACNRBV_10390 [Ralstonia pseudosolanacearum]|uniref:hypothetical protein n=1 Tax=Ralstonia pseudosolanacearum TaxID=1310165 RepID=UPI0018A6697C|nr:hypothetical protein [Ralstonia pseudosolanacearum]BCL92130.1 hypothetical protein MAFF211479_18310 [Ralstonia solanacearum]BCN04694.1 hypothetical protein RPSB_18310 [Ralstonia solanacearum]BCN10103.1 hypothetical protein RPSD_19880 [Ralstonia solanacearum]